MVNLSNMKVEITLVLNYETRNNIKILNDLFDRVERFNDLGLSMPSPEGCDKRPWMAKEDTELLISVDDDEPTEKIEFLATAEDVFVPLETVDIHRNHIIYASPSQNVTPTAPIIPGYTPGTALEIPTNLPKFVPTNMMGGDSIPPRPIIATGNSTIPVELDADHIPWDARIHSEGKTKSVKGFWRTKKNLKKEYVAGIIQELKNAMGAPTAEQATPRPPTAPVQIAPPPPAGAQEPEPPFVTFMKWLTDLLGQKKITHEFVNSTVRSFGIDTIPTLQARPDLIPLIQAVIQRATNNG